MQCYNTKDRSNRGSVRRQKFPNFFDSLKAFQKTSGLKKNCLQPATWHTSDKQKYCPAANQISLEYARKHSRCPKLRHSFEPLLPLPLQVQLHPMYVPVKGWLRHMQAQQRLIAPKLTLLGQTCLRSTIPESNNAEELKLKIDYLQSR